jgi:tetratricopeptide (TPR) repeat protein
VALGLIVGEAAVQAWAAYQFHAARQDLEHRRFAAARAHLRRCLGWPARLRLWPPSGRLHFLAARAARLDGDAEAAEEHLAAAEALQGVTAENALEWALLHVQNGGLDQYEQSLYDQAGKAPPETFALICEAAVEGNLRLFRSRQALACAGRWLERQPDNPRALYWRGRVWQQAGAYKKAAPDYGRAVELAPDDDDARLRFANALIQTSRFGEALGQLEVLRQRRPDDPEVLVPVAYVLTSLGRQPEARAVLDQTLAAHPDCGPALTAEGQLAQQEGRFDDAERWLTRALAVSPYDRQANYVRYLCLQHSGHEAEAGEQLARLKAIEQRIDRLQVINRKEMADRPRDPALHYEVGTLLRGLGSEETAADWFRSALALDPHYAPARAALDEYDKEHGERPAAEKPHPHEGPFSVK